MNTDEHGSGADPRILDGRKANSLLNKPTEHGARNTDKALYFQGLSP